MALDGSPQARAVLDDDLRIVKRTVHDQISLTELAGLAWGSTPTEAKDILTKMSSVVSEMELEHCGAMMTNVVRLLDSTKDWAGGGTGGFVWHESLRQEAPYDDV